MVADDRAEGDGARGAGIRDRPPGTISADEAALLHRYLFLRPLCAGRTVVDVAGANEFTPPPPGELADIVLWLRPMRGDDIAAALPALRRKLRPGGVLALAVVGRAALVTEFRHVVAFLQRPVAGTLIIAERFARARTVPLADAVAEDATWTTLLLASDSPITPPASMMFEADPPGALVPRATPEAAPSWPEQADTPPLEAGYLDMRRRAVSLVERLAELDDNAVALQAENSRLRRAMAELPAEASAGAARAFDVPRTQHPWPVADHPDRPRDELTPYERRPDDDVIDEGRAGEAFFRRFALLSDNADLAAAVASLNAMPRALRLSGTPDVSIVIPVHGQIAYTLNCLHSLFGHASRHSAEILLADDASPDATADFLPRVDGIRTQRRERNIGFLRSCNEAAMLARGRFLLLLNNDTRVVAGWLDALLESFALFPNAGLVGSKLFYHDGTLQEGGGIVWRDGSAWNYGRNDDPNRPNYTHARKADYVSGASIALPIDVWRQLGGFDAMFAPAYCEDTDLAMRVRLSGREVWFQPQSRAVHYEGRTAGTDPTAGVKAYQEINKKKLFVRWHDTLAGHRANGEAPYFERERDVRKRALIVDATTPTPKQDAGSVTTLQTLSLFQRLGYKTYFVPQDNFLYQPEYSAELLRMGIECAYLPYEGPFENYIRRYGALLDAVFVYRMPVLQATLAEIRRAAPQAPILFHTMDLHFLRMERQAELDGTLASRTAAARMKARELDLIARVDCTITHSTFERDLLAREVPGAPVVVWPFMFEHFGTTVGFAARQDFVFLGGYKHLPNIDAAQFFAREVLPLIREQAPDVRFIVAGANPGPEIRALESPHVIVTGQIEDLRDIFDAARIFVCPLRFGAGTKGKISTAMSYGLPVVSTLCGAEGMELVAGEEVLIADTPDELAAACLRVYRDPALWALMSEAGQRLVREYHSLEMGQRKLAEAIDAGWRHKLGL